MIISPCVDHKINNKFIKNSNILLPKPTKSSSNLITNNKIITTDNIDAISANNIIVIINATDINSININANNSISANVNNITTVKNSTNDNKISNNARTKQINKNTNRRS